MKAINDIRQSDEITAYLVKRGILKQYLKAKTYLLSGYTESVDLKPRQPKTLGIWQFRITQKYRAFWAFKWNVFHVFRISDHQDD